MNKQVREIAAKIAATRFTMKNESASLLDMVKREARGSLPHLDEKTGIEFYHCGGNASHEFYLGVSADGKKLYKRSCCYDTWLDEHGVRQVYEEDNVDEIDPSRGIYLGSH
jgi:hypothetical protein